MKRQILIVIAGVLAWLTAVGVCWQVNDARLTTVLMPLWRPLFALAGQGPNIGTPEDPTYEATPVHAMLGLAGIGLSAVLYIGVVWGWVAWRQRRLLRLAKSRTL
jgi:hypothetical protein